MRLAAALFLFLVACSSSTELDAGVDAGSVDLSLLDAGSVDLSLLDAGSVDLSLADLSNCFVPSPDVSACESDAAIGPGPGGLFCDAFGVIACAAAGNAIGCYARFDSCVGFPAPTPPYDSVCAAASTDRGPVAYSRCGDGPPCPTPQTCVSDRPGGRPFCACPPSGTEPPTLPAAPDPTCAAVTGTADTCPGTTPVQFPDGPRDCNETFRAQCIRWAQAESAGCTRARSVCANDPISTSEGPRILCVRGDHCGDAGVESCQCGTSPACNDGQVCVVDPDGIARCHCAAVAVR